MTFNGYIRRNWCLNSYHHPICSCDIRANSGEKCPFRLGRGTAQRGEGDYLRNDNSESDASFSWLLQPQGVVTEG